MSITPEESVTVEWLHTLFKEPYFSARIDAVARELGIRTMEQTCDSPKPL